MITRLRSLIFDFAFYTFTAAYFVLFAPFIVIFPRSFLFFLFKTWTRICLWMLSVIVGLRYTVRGREYLDVATANGPCIIACKHQSAFDTIFISLYLKDIVIILKGQLAYVPFFGYYLKKLGSIFIDRENKATAIRDLIKKCRDAVTNNRSLFIFPEGTRTKPGESLPYQRGISLLYRDLNVPVVPVALNTGVFWGRKSFFKYPGDIVIDIQPAIFPGMERDAFLDTLQNTIDTASLNLLSAKFGPKKKSWFKKLIILLIGIVLCGLVSGYFGLKMVLDQKMNQIGIHFSASHIRFSYHALPTYELTQVRAGGASFSGINVMADSLRITPTSRNSYTIEAKNLSAQLFQNIFVTIGACEAFVEISSSIKVKQHIPYLNFKNTVVKVGSFVSILNELQASYFYDLNTMTFSCSTPRLASVEAPLLNINFYVRENLDKSLKGNCIIQSTVAQPFIEALQQQGLITSDKASELIQGLQLIAYERNQNLKQIEIPFGE